MDRFPGAGLRNTPAELDDEIQNLTEEDGALRATDPVGALTLRQRAYTLLPEPRTAYDDSIWLLRDIGEAQFELGRYADAAAGSCSPTRRSRGSWNWRGSAWDPGSGRTRRIESDGASPVGSW